ELRPRERRDRQGPNIHFDENDEYPPLHIAYTTTVQSDRPSLHNKAARKISQWARRWGWLRVDRWKCASHAVEVDEMSEDIDEHDEIFEPEDVIDYMDDVVPSAPQFMADLSSLVVFKREKREKRKKRRRCFEDESLKQPLFHPSDQSMEKEDEPIRLSSLHTQCVASIRFQPVCGLLRLFMPQFPCFPPAWRVTQDDARFIFGYKLNFPVIARYRDDELELCEDSRFCLLMLFVLGLHF
ncbi:hypothetical protein PMAYCL1PPCAC_01068, partial [Pristionchus mayeri]